MNNSESVSKETHTISKDGTDGVIANENEDNNNETNTTAIKIYLCLHCNKAFNHVGNRTRHKKKCQQGASTSKVTSKAKDEFECSNKWCDRVFERKHNMARHTLICKPKSADLKTCFICKKEFSRMTHLRRHLRIHAAGKAKKLKCSKCNVIFKNQKRYEKHVSMCDGRASMLCVDSSTPVPIPPNHTALDAAFHGHPRYFADFQMESPFIAPIEYAPAVIQLDSVPLVSPITTDISAVE